MNNSHDKKPDQLSKRVLGRITDEHLSPRPRWEFLLKNYGFWGLGALAVCFGALAVSAILFELQNIDWSFFGATSPGIISFFFETAPFVWIFVLAVFTFFGYLYIRKTTHGYRYSPTVITLGAILLSLVLGSALYAMGFGGPIEESLGDHPPFYRPILVEEHAWWIAPNKGLLAGNVEQVAPGATSFVLRDFSGKEWTINTNDLSNRDLATVARGGTVRVVGVPITATTTVFHACFVFPWVPQGMPPQGPGPLPLALVASTSGKGDTDRSVACKDIQPYRQLQNLEDTWLY
jgi:hypothetical protein